MNYANGANLITALLLLCIVISNDFIKDSKLLFGPTRNRNLLVRLDCDTADSTCNLPENFCYINKICCRKSLCEQTLYFPPGSQWASWSCSSRLGSVVYNRSVDTKSSCLILCPLARNVQHSVLIRQLARWDTKAGESFYWPLRTEILTSRHTIHENRAGRNQETVKTFQTY